MKFLSKTKLIVVFSHNIHKSKTISIDYIFLVSQTQHYKPTKACNVVRHKCFCYENKDKQSRIDDV